MVWKETSSQARRTSSLFFDLLPVLQAVWCPDALRAVQAFLSLRIEIFETARSRFRWIDSGSKELIAFYTANIVSCDDATKSGAYRKDIRGAAS